MSHWSSIEWEKVVRMREEGFTIPVIATALCRKPNQVKEKIRWEGMTVSQREARAARIRHHKTAYRERVSSQRPLDMVRIDHRPPQEILAEREMRYAAGPRDLTGAFFGDPNFGFSAFDKKQRGLAT